MPTISVKRDALFAALGKIYTDEEFQDLCFEFGLELDEVTTEKQMLIKEQGDQAGTGVSEEILYRIDIPANRYDLLCLEGLVNGILVFQGKKEPPAYRLAKYEDIYSLHLTPATAQIRPYAVAAILKGVSFTKESYNSFIDLQDKLHQNICRKRSLVAIGTHDLDTIHGPFVYDALPPSEIKFRALNQSKEMTAPELMELYSTHAQLKQYLGIIRDSPVYPVIKDKNGVVISMPPIINGDHSKITLDTKNVFIECTATDLTKAIIVLDTIVCMFSEYCSSKYEVQQCKVFGPDGTYELYPQLRYRDELINVDKANNYIGIRENGNNLAALLSRMCLTTTHEDSTLRVRVPPTRHDVIHACDLYEDIAIAYGYNRIERRPCEVATTGGQVPLNKVTEQLRQECAHAGFTEALTFTLCSREDIASKLGVKIEAVPAVHISNPKTLEFQVVRTLLLPGLLKTLAANKKMPLPLKLFEISDVVLKDDKAETGARNERRLCAIYCGKAAGFQYVHGLLDRVMALLRHPWDKQTGYYLRQCDDPGYFPGRCAEVVLRGQAIGKVGVVHPDALAAFDLSNPCSAVEINIEPLL
ncbi:phenylalanine--tRNA ligase beta subunit isoform X1 [Maniola hyperantus]|uniref:phenylalanine--tRNA ligase beta subunit isoform X1 n=2 Tax=Aphantopus hyperantus TaxID=2795564 RepID=UPI00156A62B2|nr:phenylalanine--tRNA ligase beta subunit [Maniola hyperantus]